MTKKWLAPNHTVGSKFWRFYCWRCEQWCETDGPWCDLYKSEPRIAPCYFDEYPKRADGVPWPQKPPLE